MATAENLIITTKGVLASINRLPNKEEIIHTLATDCWKLGIITGVIQKDKRDMVLIRKRAHELGLQNALQVLIEAGVFDVQ